MYCQIDQFQHFTLKMSRTNKIVSKLPPPPPTHAHLLFNLYLAVISHLL